jgi:phospholipase C
VKSLALLLLTVGLAAPALGQADKAGPKGLTNIENIVVIYLENHSFDNLYGLFPGADGLAQAPRDQTVQTDRQGRPYTHLPRVMSTLTKPPQPDVRFPEKLPNQPFEISQFVPLHEKIGDPVHRFFQHQEQMDGGRNDRFAAVSNVGGLVMGYYDGRKLPLWPWAQRYTLADRFFAAAHGGSFLNHMWLACACTPRYPDASRDSRIALNEKGEVVKDGPVTADGYAVNTIYSAQAPHSPKATGPGMTLPPLTEPTLGDRLSDKQVSWAWYAAGWNDALGGRADPSYQYHHQPYTYFRRYAEKTPDRAAHLKDEADFLAAMDRGQLPAVSFYKPLGRYNEHPGDTDLFAGETRTAEILTRLEQSPQWGGMLVIVTYDEYGGFWDHVPPPKGDRWGPATRVPTLLISPFTLGGRVDHTTYDTTSILRLIEERFGLAPLGERDAKTNSLSATLRF